LRRQRRLAKPKGSRTDQHGVWTLTVDQLLKLHDGEPEKMRV
jgi:hypothetical protein